jgi:hypothetical protein
LHPRQAPISEPTKERGMGSLRDKADDERDAAAASWARKAQNEDYRCNLCGRLIEYADREAYFGSKRCSDCANYARKED